MTEEYSIWVGKIKECRIPRFDELPDIDLYMDQVISQLDKYLDAVGTGEEHIITASMVNNYVKQQLLPPPVKKRYSRTHMAYLIVICLLKPALSIPDIKTLLDAHMSGDNLSEAYNALCAVQEETLAQTAVKAEAATADDMFSLAAKAALMSAANKAFAVQLIGFVK